MRELIQVESSSIAPEDESDHSQRGDVAGVSSFPHASQEESSSSYDEEDEHGSSDKERKQSEKVCS